MSTSARPPWKKPNPAKKAGRSRKLTSAEKEEAKAAAKKAGRRYPNLVDNMHVASKRRTRSAAH
jgi:hypothetical protein